RTLDVRPLVIVSEVLFLFELEIVEHLLEQPADATRRIRLECPEAGSAEPGHSLEVFQAGIRLVRSHFADGEVSSGILYQWDELRSVSGVLVQNSHGGHDVRFRAARDVNLDPNT